MAEEVGDLMKTDIDIDVTKAENSLKSYSQQLKIQLPNGNKWKAR